jgi:hypothetical protein
LLILSGPALEAQVPFEISIFNIATETSTLLGALEGLQETTVAKAEAISVLSHDQNAVDVLVMFDGLESGGPRRYTISLK